MSVHFEHELSRDLANITRKSKVDQQSHHKANSSLLGLHPLEPIRIPVMTPCSSDSSSPVTSDEHDADTITAITSLSRTTSPSPSPPASHVSDTRLHGPDGLSHLAQVPQIPQVPQAPQELQAPHTPGELASRATHKTNNVVSCDTTSARNMSARGRCETTSTTAATAGGTGRNTARGAGVASNKNFGVTSGSEWENLTPTSCLHSFDAVRGEQIVAALGQIVHKLDALFPMYRLSDADCKKLSWMIYDEFDFIERIFCNAVGRLVEVMVYYYGSVQCRKLYFYNSKDSDREINTWRDVYMSERYCLSQLGYAKFGVKVSGKHGTHGMEEMYEMHEIEDFDAMKILHSRARSDEVVGNHGGGRTSKWFVGNNNVSDAKAWNAWDAWNVKGAHNKQMASY